jgi:hypothetical protein
MKKGGLHPPYACYQLENHRRLLGRIEQARQSLREGRGVKIEDVE